MTEQKDIAHMLDMIELEYELTALRVRARRCMNEIEAVRRRLIVLQRVMEERAHRARNNHNGDDRH
jgi:hypothetical protein